MPTRQGTRRPPTTSATTIGIAVNFICAFTIKESVKTETAPEKNKLGVLIGSGVTTLILGASGYDGAAATQTASALSTIKGVYLYLPLAFAVVIFVIMCFYKLNSKNYNHIVSELEQGHYHPDAKYAPHSEG